MTRRTFAVVVGGALVALAGNARRRVVERAGEWIAEERPIEEHPHFALIRARYPELSTYLAIVRTP